MADDRPFPPSPRRLGLARRAGIHAASPVVVGAAACAAVVLALAVLGGAMAERLGGALASACAVAGADDAIIAPSPSLAPAAPRTAMIEPAHLADAVLALALPLLAAAALAALIAHLAQTRTLWLPRRRLEGAPAPDRGGSARVRRAGVDLIAATIIGLVAFAWLWWIAPRLAALPVAGIGAGAALVASALAAIAIAWVAIAACDALLRHAELARTLRMSAREKREDDRLAAADPRWRRLRTRREPEARTAVAGATLLLLGDDAAIAIAWDPHRRPIPLRTASGRGARATQLLGLARRHRIPVHRDPHLAELIFGDGPIPETHWARLAELVAALRSTAPA